MVVPVTPLFGLILKICETHYAQKPLGCMGKVSAYSGGHLLPLARFCSSGPKGSHEEWRGVIKALCHWGKLQGTWWATEVGKSTEILGVSPFLPHTPSSSGPFQLFPLPWSSHYRPVHSLLQRGSFLPSYVLLPLYFISTVDFNSNTATYWTLPP